MAYFRITYGCGCGENEEYIEAKNLQAAVSIAYENAIEDYESYEGLHGIRSLQDIAEEDFDVDIDEVDYDSALYADIEAVYFDERESQLYYNAEEVSEEEWKENME